MTTSALPGPAENRAWCTVTGGNGHSVRTNSYDAYPNGARFVQVLDPAGRVAGWWPSETWTDPQHAEATMAAIWTMAGAGLVDDPEYGRELSWPLDHGEVRACPNGTYVRVLYPDGTGVDDGSAHWVVDEWVEDGELVMGAVLGTARSLAP